MRMAPCHQSEPGTPESEACSQKGWRRGRHAIRRRRSPHDAHGHHGSERQSRARGRRPERGLPIGAADEREAHERAWSRMIEEDQRRQLEGLRAVRRRGEEASPPSSDEELCMVPILPPGAGGEVARGAGPPDGSPTGVPATSGGGAGPSTLPWAPREGEPHLPPGFGHWRWDDVRPPQRE